MHAIVEHCEIGPRNSRIAHGRHYPQNRPDCAGDGAVPLTAKLSNRRPPPARPPRPAGVTPSGILGGAGDDDGYRRREDHIVSG